MINKIIHDFLVLFAMVNAVGNLPIFADLTAGMDKPDRIRTYRLAVFTGGSIVIAFALAGDILLRSVFNVSTSAFKVAGGILVFIVAARGVILGKSPSNSPAHSEGPVAIFPMGFPYLAGPGTILTTILLIQTNGRFFTALTALLVYTSIIPVLYMAPLVEKVFGRVGVMVVSRILYIFICAKAVSFVLEGLTFYFH